MEKEPEGHVQYTIQQASSGQWEVQQSGFSAAIASFRNKSDAIEYAQRLAATKPSADVITGEPG